MIKLAVFDWNGTLLADFNPVVEGFNKVLEVYGRPPASVQAYRRHYEMPISKLLQNFGVTKEEIEAKAIEGTQAFHSFYEPRVARAHTRGGTRAMLEELSQKKVNRIILSNHTMEGIYLQLDRLKLSDHFETVLANDSQTGALRSGKQHRLEAYFAESHHTPSDAVIIGDTVEEIHIGKNLGLKTIAISGGYAATWRLREAKPDLIISSLYDINKAMEDL